MSLIIENPQQIIEETVEFLKQTYDKVGARKAVIAVSGGIDSALSLSLLTKAVGPENIIPVFLPYKNQDMSDAKEICKWNKIAEEQWVEVAIDQTTDLLVSTIGIDSGDNLQTGGVDAHSGENDDKFVAANENALRKGNVMARIRMIVVYDIAKKNHALVCGTENKSENFLGYFTRFGDEASDVEPILNFYKTQVRQLVEYLNLPSIFLDKKPSAGLWQDQTDEQQFGFTYQEADQVLFQVFEQSVNKLDVVGVSPPTVEKVLEWVKAQDFKHHVPYKISD
ncbi:NAD(+) synthase [Candidatus Woesebacteria bacterium]|nr:NAD(+) synthase [Candidatus Woesebacteria bacterium]